MIVQWGHLKKKHGLPPEQSEIKMDDTRSDKKKDRNNLEKKLKMESKDFENLMTKDFWQQKTSKSEYMM